MGSWVNIRTFVTFSACVFSFALISVLVYDKRIYEAHIFTALHSWNTLPKPDSDSAFNTSLPRGLKDGQLVFSSNHSYKIYFAGHLFGRSKTWSEYFPDWSTKSHFVCDAGFRCQLSASDADADAVIFHARELSSVNLPDMLKRRRLWQRWVFFSWESIIHANLRLRPPWEGQFNWTATYMRQSDAVAAYCRGYVNLTAAEAQKVATGPLYEPNKKKLAFAVISNCQPKARLNLIRSLQRFMPVDLYGNCGRRFSISIAALSRQYRFYLAFENSRCRDYITEKFWFNGLSGDAVPVALGGYERKDYERVAPPNSFVYANDYPSAERLAQFLKDLAATEPQYAKYHEWKRQWKVDRYSMKNSVLCNLCRRLHSDKEKKVSVIHKFWNRSAYCHNPRTAGLT